MDRGRSWLALKIAFGLLLATALQGCSDEEAVEQAREEAIREGEALKGVQDAVGEYRQQKEKTINAKDNVQAKKDEFNKVLADEGRKPEGDEAMVLDDANKILKEEAAAEKAENAVEHGEAPAKGGSSLLVKVQPRKSRSRNKKTGVFLSALASDAREPSGSHRQSRTSAAFAQSGM
mmetsp:Transcript_12880/g.24258  ORF Transcript_12880/g.24258 Transcript_12880/m.24258 type:complete len:177 (+) Transcript_12880:154-684(+)